MNNNETKPLILWIDKPVYRDDYLTAHIQTAEDECVYESPTPVQVLTKEAEAELAELKRDRIRLEVLSKYPSILYHDEEGWGLNHTYLLDKAFDTFREALDALVQADQNL